MNPERFARLREILLTHPRLPESERGPYLDRACADDPELRREAESLLAWAGRTDTPGAVRTGGAAGLIDFPSGPQLPDARDEMPEAIGRYRILGVLGHGGMGVVYRAEETHPLRREVAVKLCRPGLEHRSVLARFQLERQALALMEHPGIAKALDAGEHEDGRPYFVMELVRGVPITEFCSSNSLSLRQRLALFRDVCDAVEHAHRKGILHRDLKPSNVLVTTQAGAPAPKVIDFGIAKAMEERASGMTMTLEGQLIGTLEYMSPEQALGRLVEMDTRSDVYSLGVILYELVTDRLPYETKGKPLLEAARVVARAAPAPLRGPSAGETRIDEEVGTIVLKALEKEPDRRYGSAAALGEDIDRFLRGHPLLARPPSTAYQLRKLVARNKIPFALAGSLFLLLVAFGATMSFLFQSQRAERARAEAEAAKAREVSGFLSHMLSTVKTQGHQVTVREVLDAASRDVETEFRGRPGVEAALRSTIGSAYVALQKSDQAERHLRTALEMRRALYGERSLEVAESLEELAEYYRRLELERDNQDRATSLAREALALRMELEGNEHPDLAKPIALLAEVELGMRRFPAADSLFGVALEIMTRHGEEDDPEVPRLLHRRAMAKIRDERTLEGEAELHRALEAARRVHPGDHAETAAILCDLVEVGESAEEKERTGLESLTMSRRLWGDGHPNLILPLDNLGVFYAYSWRFDEGEPLLREALEIAEAELDPSGEAMANCCNSLAALLDRKGKWGEAEPLYRRGLTIWLAKLGPSHYRTFLGRANLARTLDRLGRDDESWALYQKGLALAEEAEGEDSGMASLHLHRMAALLNRRGRFREAVPLARRSVEIMVRMMGPQGVPENGNWAEGLRVLADALHGLGQLEEAEEYYRRADSALRVGGELKLTGLPNLIGLGRCLCAEGRLDEAQLILEQAEELFRTRVGTGHPDYADALLALGELHAKRGEDARARALLESSRDLLLANAPQGDLRLAAVEHDLAGVR